MSKGTPSRCLGVKVLFTRNMFQDARKWLILRFLWYVCPTLFMSPIVHQPSCCKENKQSLKWTIWNEKPKGQKLFLCCKWFHTLFTSNFSKILSWKKNWIWIFCAKCGQRTLRKWGISLEQDWLQASNLWEIVRIEFLNSTNVSLLYIILTYK